MRSTSTKIWNCIILSGLLVSSSTFAYYNLGAFWKLGGPAKFIFTTAPQTLNAATCSSIVTVQASNGAGGPYVTQSPLTLYLFGNGATFFSDAGCTSPITGVTIPGHSSSANFYFESQATNPIEASVVPTNVTPAVQTETVNLGTTISGFAYTNGSYTGGNNYWGDTVGISYAVYGQNLYMGYYLNSGSNPVLVAFYNNNDSSPGWTATNSGASITYANGGSVPQLITFGNLLYATWTENNGSHNQIRVKSFNGATWSAADSGSLNVNTAEDAGDPAFGVYNGNLYIAWDENNLVHVARFGEGTSWNRIDDNGSGGTNGTSMNYANDLGGANQPVLYGASGGLFISWDGLQNETLRIKIFNGVSWSPADGGSGIQTGATSIYWQPISSTFAEFNGETYIGWINSGVIWNGQVHVAAYKGGTTWALVDGGAQQGLTAQAGVSSTVPRLMPYQDRLYVLWEENDSAPNIVFPAAQTRISVYNGNDASPSWSSIVGPSFDGMGYIPWFDNGQYVPTMAVVNNKLYAGWEDSEEGDTGVFTQSTTPTKLWFPNLVNNDSNGGVYETAGCMPDEVRTVDANGNPSFIGSATVVTLSAGAGLSFYLDSDCTQSLPSNQVTISVGDSGAHFYFQVVSGGNSFTISGAALSGLAGATQAVNNPNDDVWIGGAGCNQLWNTGACWSTGNKPQQYQTAVFSGALCTTNCSATINTNNLNGMNDILLEGDYTGTVTQLAGKSPTIVGLLDIEGGTFTASSSAADTFSAGGLTVSGTGVLNGGVGKITLNDDFVLSGGGSFTSTTGIFTVGGNFTILGSPTFIANGGTVNFGTISSTVNPTILSGSAVFNNVTFSVQSWANLAISGPLTVWGNLVESNQANANVVSGTIALAGTGPQTVSDTTGNGMGGGGVTILVNSTSTVTASSSFGTGGLTIQAGTFNGGTGLINLNNDFNQTGGTFNSTTGTFTVGGNFTITGAPTFNANGGTFNFATVQSIGNVTITPGSISFNNVVFAGQNYTNDTISGTMNVAGNTTIAGSTTSSNIFGGTLSVAGNLTLTSNSGGNAAVTFVGGNPQAFSTTGGTFPSGAVTVNKTPGTTLALNSDLVVNSGGQNFNITSGTVDMKGHNLSVRNIAIADTLFVDGAGTISVKGTWSNTGTFLFGTGTVSFSSGNHTIAGSTIFYKLSLVATSARTLTFTAGTTQTVNNSLTLSGVAGGLLSLVSSSSGTPWNLVPPTGTTLGGHLSVQDSDSSAAIHTGAGSSLVSGNTNWISP